ncbi:peptidoglycan-binding protein [Streptomyces griseus]|uniref:peptidoglycan-binding domain-containing protein n=1 Tax=Streptomyces griseus TaxID=1911 RepID=UPI00055C2153|nr:peptidoglycan-binding domain-containing protein [Streptomyces griseus]
MPTPQEPGAPDDRPPLEPIRVMRLRRTDALAELFKELTQDTGEYESVRLPRSAPGSEAETQELPPVSTGRRDPARDRVPRHRPRSGRGTLVAACVLAAALVGFGCAFLLPGGKTADTATPAPPTSAPAPTAGTAAPAAPAPRPSTDPDGAGTLREGDSGAEVTDLQQRLLRIPNVYDHGPTDGRYDAVLTEAVARFQLWYGIRGDETGVYGDDTRRDLESRTGGG